MDFLKSLFDRGATRPIYFVCKNTIHKMWKHGSIITEVLKISRLNLLTVSFRNLPVMPK